MMSDNVELARDGLERTENDHPAHSDRNARRVAIVISTLAAALAIAEMGEKAAQNEYLTHHIAVSDDWAFYQAKTVRAELRRVEASLLQSGASSTDGEVTARVAAALAEAQRLDDDEKTQGRKQLADRARAQEVAREAAGARYHHLELVVGALQIAIVLASVAVVTRLWALAWVASALGGLAGLGGLIVSVGLT